MAVKSLAAVCFVPACVLALASYAATIPVTNTNDNGPGSLRQALSVANNGDTIDATGVSGVIHVTTGELLIDKSVTINGAGADVLAIDANMLSRVFEIPASSETITISDLTIRNGHDDTTGGGIENGSGATLTITNCVISGNTAGSVGAPAVAGGGIFNGGTATIVNSTISGNMAGGIAGGGGGIFNVGAVTIVNSTFNGNMAITGAGVDNDGKASTVMISNSTFSGNAALAYGGACLNLGILQIANSTLSDNSARDFAGGIVNNGTVQIASTILNRGNPANMHSFGGTITSMGYNVSSDDGGGFLTGPSDQINTDPLLGLLQDNGGPTFTHALLPGSPAIDSGDPSFTPPPFFDQRGPGFTRVVNNRIDKGSFEVQAGSTPTPTPGATVTPTATPTSTPSPNPTATATPTATPRPTITPRGGPTARPRPSPPPRP